MPRGSKSKENEVSPGLGIGVGVGVVGVTAGDDVADVPDIESCGAIRLLRVTGHLFNKK